MFALKRLPSRLRLCAVLLVSVQACGGDVTIGDNRSGAESAPSSTPAQEMTASGERDIDDPWGEADDDEAFGDCLGRFGGFEEFRDGGVSEPCGDREPDGFQGEPSGPMDGFGPEEFFGPPTEDPRESFDGGVWAEKDL